MRRRAVLRRHRTHAAARRRAYRLPAPIAAADRAARFAVDGTVGAGRDRPRRRRHPAHLRRRPSAMRSSASATSTLRIGCGRWSSSGGSATAGCRRSSARRRCRRTGSCGRSASAARRARRGSGCRTRPGRRSTRTSPASMRSSPRITARAAAGVHAAPLRAGAVDRRRRGGVAEDDGVGSERQLLATSCCAATSLARVGPERTAELMPPYPRERLEHSAAVPAIAADAGGERTAQAIVKRPASTAPPMRGDLVRRVRAGAVGGRRSRSQTLLARRRATESLGSNNWVVDGTLTASGKPLLANDPHLGTHVPSLWYLAHMSAGDFDVDRRDAPGHAGDRDRPQPVHRLGRDQRGRRRRGSLSRASSIRPGKLAEFRGAQEPLRIVPETITVKRRRPGRARRAHHPPRSARLRRDQRQQRRRRPSEPKPAAARTARVPVDRARRIGRHGRRRSCD